MPLATGAWGRFTKDGSAEVEAHTRAVVSAVGEAVDRALPRSDYEALVLIGGYGRGEGGVEVREGQEVPHNNLDFLLLSRGGDPEAYKHRVDPALQALSREHGIGIDLGVVSTRALLHSPCQVMWYDMRHGHKTILGNERFVPGLQRFTLERIERSDMRTLLTNRGTLLLINDLLLEGGAAELDRRKLVIKHAVKAIIGYGDALLFFLGDYHWSYVEKQRRMRARTDVASEFQALYDRALTFRFRPSYADYLDRDLSDWALELKRQLSAVHLIAERRRLRRTLGSWQGYQELALAHAVIEDLPGLRALARKARNALCRPPASTPLPFSARLGLRLAGPRGWMPIVFPAVAYPDQADGSSLERARALLGAHSVEPPSLRRAYLRSWLTHGDPNFANVLRRYSIDLGEARP